MTDTRKKRQDGIRSLDAILGRCFFDTETGCWLWRGAMGRSTTRKAGATPRVHLPAGVDGDRSGSTTGAKAAWLLAGHPLPAGHVVWRHVCDRAACINPAHGMAGPRQTMHKALAASDRLKGDPWRAAVNARNRSSMLTPVDVVRRAEEMFEAGEMQKTVRAALGILASTAALIRKGQHPHSAGRQALVARASVFSWAQAA